MPVFLDFSLSQKSNEFLSIFAAFCEENHSYETLLNLLNPYFHQKIILNQIVGFLEKYKILNSTPNEMELFSPIFIQPNKRTLLVKKFIKTLDYHLNLFGKLYAIYDFFLPGNLGISSLENKSYSTQKDNIKSSVLYSSQQECDLEAPLVFFVTKSFPIGCSFLEISKFLKKSKVFGIKGKGKFSIFFLSQLAKKGSLCTIKWKCCNIGFLKRRFSTNYNGERKKNNNLPPCLNCPVHYECHPQGIINPFDCIFFNFSEKDFFGC